MARVGRRKTGKRLEAAGINGDRSVQSPEMFLLVLSLSIAVASSEITAQPKIKIAIDQV
jgi:hypothetical protein